jgi:Tfp pilus assembly protein PilX
MTTNECVHRDNQTGGITILVSLMLLVLLTVTAVAMSRNSLREIFISGTLRQGAEARNVADNGLEWSIYWMSPLDAGPKAPVDIAAKDFLDPVKAIALDPTMSGQIQEIDPSGVMIRTDSDGAKRTYSLAFTNMGKLRPDKTGGAPSTGGSDVSTAVASVTWPDLWSIRSTGIVSYGVTGMDFQHTREAWIKCPPKIELQ